MVSKKKALLFELLLKLETYDADIYLSQLEFCLRLLNLSSVCEALLVVHCHPNPAKI